MLDLVRTRVRMSLCVVVLVMCGVSLPATAQRRGNIVCETPVEGPRSVRATFEEFYECTEPLFDAWLKKYPREVAQLEQLYKVWEAGRVHDLRSHSLAAEWVKKYPVTFSERSVELSAAQVERGVPGGRAEPVQVSGAFERMFVDRDNRRLFLTSAEEGLVSIGIAERYAFTLEGSVGKGGARDFFVYDSQTAFVEEPNPAGGNRDLVVLDISNRARPKEVARLKGALPALSWFSVLGDEHLKAPPTFDEYIQIRSGKMPTTCGNKLPQVSMHPRVYCRPDGSCYRLESGKVTDDGVCRQSVTLERNRTGGGGGGFVRTGTAVGSGTGGMAQRGSGEQVGEQARGGEGFGRVGGLPAGMQVVPGPMGGAGGAGSLSQMMIHGSMLYVLTGHEAMNRGWLTTFDVSKPRSPRLRHVIALDNGPEALQRHDNLLLIAGRTTVVTASLGVPASPRLVGELRQTCPVNRDPIVMQGHIGYRTIISENRGPRCPSRLEVLDLSQPHQPVLRTTIPMAKPRGLAGLSRLLYVADENNGVVLFDLVDPVNPRRIGEWRMYGVKDLVLSDFDLYAMSGDEIQTFYVGGLYRQHVDVAKAHEQVVGVKTVKRTYEMATAGEE